MPGKLHKASKVYRLLVCWWMFSSLPHIILDGYFVLSPDFYEKTPHYLAEVWKFFMYFLHPFINLKSKVRRLSNTVGTLRSTKVIIGWERTQQKRFKVCQTGSKFRCCCFWAGALSGWSVCCYKSCWAWHELMIIKVMMTFFYARKAQKVKTP